MSSLVARLAFIAKQARSMVVPTTTLVAWLPFVSEQSRSHAGRDTLLQLFHFELIDLLHVLSPPFLLAMFRTKLRKAQ